MFLRSVDSVLKHRTATIVEGCSLCIYELQDRFKCPIEYLQHFI